MVTHKTAVDEHILLAFLLLGVLGLGNETGNLHKVGLLLHRVKLILEMGAKNRDDALAEVGGFELQHQFAVMEE